MMMMMIMMAKTEKRFFLCGWFFVFGFMAAVGAESIEMSDNEPECLEGWIPIHRGCFKFVEAGAKWEEARDNCRSEKGDLTYIQSLQEKSLLEEHLHTHYPTFPTWWIGLNREEYRGRDWKWLDEVAVDTNVLSWRNHRMARRPGRVCGVLEKYGWRIYAANDICIRTNPYICEYNSTIPSPTTKAASIDSTDATITTSESAEEGGSPKTTRDIYINVKTAISNTNVSTVPPTLASTKDQKSQSPLTLSTLLSSLLPVTPSQETEEGPEPSVAPPEDVETDPSPQQLDKVGTFPTGHVATTPEVVFRDFQDGEEIDLEAERNYCQGSGSPKTTTIDFYIVFLSFCYFYVATEQFF